MIRALGSTEPLVPNLGPGRRKNRRVDVTLQVLQALDAAQVNARVLANGRKMDIDESGAVDFGDILAVLGNWGACPGCASDLDGDDLVGFSDLLIVLGSWGPC